MPPCPPGIKSRSAAPAGRSAPAIGLSPRPALFVWCYSRGNCVSAILAWRRYYRGRRCIKLLTTQSSMKRSEANAAGCYLWKRWYWQVDHDAEPDLGPGRDGKKIMVVGCDPKADSTRMLLGGLAQQTVLDTPLLYLRPFLSKRTRDIILTRRGGWLLTPLPGLILQKAGHYEILFT